MQIHEKIIIGILALIAIAVALFAVLFLYAWLHGLGFRYFVRDSIIPDLYKRFMLQFYSDLILSTFSLGLILSVGFEEAFKIYDSNNELFIIIYVVCIVVISKFMFSLSFVNSIKSCQPIISLQIILFVVLPAVIFGEGLNSFYLKGSCELGDAKACAQLGVEYQDAADLNKSNFIVAAAYFRKACSGGEVESCHNLGILYQDGNGVLQDNSKAIRYYDKACKGGERAACTNMGVMYHKGLGVSADISRAENLYKKACDMGSEQGCKNHGILMRQENK